MAWDQIISRFAERRAVRARWKQAARELIEADEVQSYYEGQRRALRCKYAGDMDGFWHWSKAATEAARLSSKAEMDFNVVLAIDDDEQNMRGFFEDPTAYIFKIRGERYQWRDTDMLLRGFPNDDIHVHFYGKPIAWITEIDIRLRSRKAIIGHFATDKGKVGQGIGTVLARWLFRMLHEQ